MISTWAVQEFVLHTRKVCLSNWNYRSRKSRIQCEWTYRQQFEVNYVCTVSGHNKRWCIVQCTLYIVHFILYIEHCTVYSVQCTVYSVQCTVYIVHCTLYIVHCTLYSVQCTVYSVQCTGYTVHLKLCTVRYSAAGHTGIARQLSKTGRKRQIRLSVGHSCFPSSPSLSFGESGMIKRNYVSYITHL